MKEKLEELTVSELIALMEGDVTVMLSDGEQVPEEILALSARNLLYEYRGIVDKAGFRSFLIESDELMKARISLQLYSMCLNLLSLDYVDEAGNILEELSINGATLGKERMLAIVKSGIARTTATIAEIERSRSEAVVENTDIRRHFDEQTVAMMAHFKFQIDTGAMNASLYAHLVSRFNREVRMLSDAMRKK